MPRQTSTPPLLPTEPDMLIPAGWVAELIKRYGWQVVPLLMCGWLIWRADAAHQAEIARMQQALSIVQTNTETLQRHVEVSEGNDAELIRVNIADCVNRAQDAGQRNNCLGVKR